MAEKLWLLSLGLVLLWLLTGPVRCAGKQLLRCAVGAGGLSLLNAMSGALGVCIPVNAVTAWVAGTLGLPGLTALMLLEWMP